MSRKERTTTELEQRSIPERQRKRRLEVTNNYDPVVESKHYPEYQKYKRYREDFEQKFEERQKKRAINMTIRTAILIRKSS